MNKIAIIIPSRLNAQRLPNKPLKLINNKEMIIHVYESPLSSKAGDVYIATPDQKIIDIKDEDIDSLKVISKLDTEICVSYEKSKIHIEELINLIKKNNVKIIDISTDDGDLEDVFLRLIKN